MNLPTVGLFSRFNQCWAMKTVKQIIKPFSSIKIAVITIIALIIVFSWGTFVESKYDARTAQNVVYHTNFTYLTMTLLVINLLFSMLIKLPWKKKHIPFLLAHIGLITIVASAYVDRVFGLDATMSIEVGKSKNWVLTEDTYINTYHSKDGDLFLPTKISSKKVNFFSNPPEKQSLSIEIEDDIAQVTDFFPYATSEKTIEESDAKEGTPALRFVLQNQFVTHSDWLIQGDDKVAYKKIGPLDIYLDSEEAREKNSSPTLIFRPVDNENIEYVMLDNGEVKKQGKISAGMSVTTPWMDMKLMILKYIPRAIEKYSYTLQKNPSDITTEVVKVNFKRVTRWIRLNSFDKFPHEKGIYLISYTNNQIGIGFDMKLNNFIIERYPGGQPKSYMSEIEVEGNSHSISMNEPFKKNGLTFYQASYREDEAGNPVVSILQVNHDPARGIKYFGAILLSIGTVLMFYKRKTT